MFYGNKILKTLQHEIIIVIVLLIAGWKHLNNLESFYDISLYDESIYLYNGVKLLKYGLPGAEKSPLYCLWYFILSLFQRDRVELFYLSSKLLAITLPLAVYLTLRLRGLTLVASACISFIFLISRANVSVWPKVCHLALLVILLSFVFASLFKSPNTRYIIIIICALINSYIRPELFIAFILLFLVYIVTVIGAFRNFTFRNYLPTVIILLLLSFLLALNKLPLSEGERSRDAFEQHFAVNYQSWTNSSINPWTNSTQIAEKEFGHIESISDAFLNNPGVFLKHVWYNISHILATAKFLFVDASILLPPAYQNIEDFFWLGLILVYLFHSRKLLFLRMKERILTEKEILVCIFCYIAPVLISIIIIYPRQHYLVVFGAFCIIGLSVLIFDKTENLTTRQLIAFCFILIAVTPLQPYLTQPHQLTHISTISFLNSLNIRHDATILEAQGGYDIYLTGNFKRVAEYEKNENFYSFLKSKRINIIVLTDQLRKDSRFEKDVEWISFLHLFTNYGYREMPIPGTNNTILIQENLLHI